MQQQLIPNTRLHGGTYKIEIVLGQGSFGITYLAEHTSLGKKVAIKEFFMKELNSRGNDGSITGMSDGSLSHNYGQKFKKEAINLSRLEHPNIVRVTDSFDENGTYYYVMDYIDGCNLNDYLKSNSVSQKEAVEIITDVAKALMYMHEEKHVLHLDLKPGNIMRRKNDGHIFLIDFGLSKHFSNDGQPETSTTIGLGTAGYAPIEQSNQAKNGEFRPTIDVYALGATLFKLLTGATPPIASDLVSDDELLRESLTKHNVSEALIAAIEKSMMPNVKKRTPTIRAFIESLPSADNTITLTSTKVAEDSEETEYVNPSDSSKETVFTGATIEKHPDFEESKYVIKSDYKNFPIMTGNKANNGDREAMLALGIMALRGEGVTQDFDTAYAWFQKLKDLGDDRGEKLVSAFSALKTKYKPVNKTQNKDITNKKGANKTSEGSNAGLWIVGIIVAIIVLVFSVKACKEKQAEEAAAAAAAEKARIESIAKNVTDWYSDLGSFYCMVEGEKYYVDYYSVPDGQRTVHYSSGDTFVGTIKEGRLSKGKLTCKNGDYFNGTFSSGSWDTGYGKKTFGDGSTYEGNWKNGQWNGYGKNTGKSSDGEDWTYEGNYQNGSRHGKGTERWPHTRKKSWSVRLDANYVNGERHGYGTWYYNDYTYEKVYFNHGKMTKRNIENGTWR